MLMYYNYESNNKKKKLSKILNDFPTLKMIRNIFLVISNKLLLFFRLKMISSSKIYTVLLVVKPLFTKIFL
jgi:hypothetical protein